MTDNRCIHGLDSRFCYGAVGEVLGVIPRAMGARLGPYTRERSWIVSAETGLPTGYSPDDMHPSLFRANEIISSATELVMRMTPWKAQRDKSG